MKKYFIGMDFAAKLKWWQRLIVWLGFRNKWSDYSCAVVFKRTGRKDEAIVIEEIIHF